MDIIKEITVFSIGDANELKTWSNVPYFFTKSIEEKKIIVNRINIKENVFLSLLYRYTIFIILKLIKKKSNHTYFRSKLNYYLTNWKIQKAVKKHNQSDVFLFLTYSFSTKKQSTKKIILFSDWSYLYYLNIFQKREPIWFEKKAIKREESNIKNADMVISLFPKSNEFNNTTYKNKNQYYLGNVINGNYPLIKLDIINKKLNSNSLLFIGNKKYLEGARDLIKAFKSISVKNAPNIELHIIGLTKDETGIDLPNIFHYGYLNKGNKIENETYYKLITGAKAIINTNQDWGAFSAMTEAMYYYTPVITSPYLEFIETYGSNINFGYFVKNNSIEELISKTETLLNNSKEIQLELMTNAHEQVKDFTWSNYLDKVLKLVNHE